MKRIDNELFELLSPYEENGNTYHPRVEPLDIVITDTGHIGFYHALKHIGNDRLTKLKFVKIPQISDKNIPVEKAKMLAVLFPEEFASGTNLSFREPDGYYEIKLSEFNIKLCKKCGFIHTINGVCLDGSEPECN